MKTILIVDDAELIRSVLADVLTALAIGCEILTAQNGKEAAKILDSVPVDLIVTDLNMPEMDGYELTEYARKNRPDIEVVVSTADCSPEVRRRLRALGVSMCFEKPFSFVELAAWIVEVFKLKSSCPPHRLPLLG